jgi:hypothetical protein
MRILCDVVLEPRLAQRARRELRVERHGADGLVNCGIALPGVAREEIPAHGRRIPGTDEVLNDVSETWWWMQSDANLSQQPNSLITGKITGNFSNLRPVSTIVFNPKKVETSLRQAEQDRQKSGLLPPVDGYEPRHCERKP